VPQYASGHAASHGKRELTGRGILNAQHAQQQPLARPFGDGAHGEEDAAPVPLFRKRRFGTLLGAA
jgi:hypothetical protein